MKLHFFCWLTYTKSLLEKFLCIEILNLISQFWDGQLSWPLCSHFRLSNTVMSRDVVLIKTPDSLDWGVIKVTMKNMFFTVRTWQVEVSVWTTFGFIQNFCLENVSSFVSMNLCNVSKMKWNLYTITIIWDHIRKENACRDDQNWYTISWKPMVCSFAQRNTVLLISFKQSFITHIS